MSEQSTALTSDPDLRKAAVEAELRRLGRP